MLTIPSDIADWSWYGSLGDYEMSTRHSVFVFYSSSYTIQNGKFVLASPSVENITGMSYESFRPSKSAIVDEDTNQGYVAFSNTQDAASFDRIFYFNIASTRGTLLLRSGADSDVAGNVGDNDTSVLAGWDSRTGSSGTFSAQLLAVGKGSLVGTVAGTSPSTFPPLHNCLPAYK